MKMRAFWKTFTRQENFLVSKLIRDLFLQLQQIHGKISKIPHTNQTARESFTNKQV